MKVKITLITGGSRSGKSRFAQELAQQSRQPVLFVATAEPGDEEMRQRIAQHQQDRPPAWQTLEATSDLGRQITQNIGPAPTVIIDCVTILVSNILLRHSKLSDENTSADLIEQEVITEIKGIINCARQAPASFIVVTNEVGLGLVPANKTGRLYRDLLGKANQLLAQHADEVYLMVSGIPVPVKTGGAQH